MSELQGFADWLRDRGRSERTAYLYSRFVAQSLDERRITARLVRTDLAPATRQVTRFALRAWAKYTEDGELARQLEEIKVPKAEPVLEKVPLSADEWNRFDEQIEFVDDPVVRAALQLMSWRGFRVGAIPQITRAQVSSALRTGLLTFRTKARILQYALEPIEDPIRAFDEQPVQWDCVADLLSPLASDATRHAAAVRRLQKFVDLVGEWAGIERGTMHPHRLRRTYSENFYEAAGQDLVRLRDHMGWADISTAARYVTRDRREELEQIAADMRRRRKG
jgi:integrase